MTQATAVSRPAPLLTRPASATAAGRLGFALVAAVVFIFGTLTPRPAAAESAGATEPAALAMPGEVACANLVYGRNKTSECFADHFLRQIHEDSFISTTGAFHSVRSDDAELFGYPFAVMSGEGRFRLTDGQIENLRAYLTSGGFLVASAGCSSKQWNSSFGEAIKAVLPEAELFTLEADHPVFHTVYDITESRYRSGGTRLPELRAIELDGRVVMIWSPDGLNDTGNAGHKCCCCGGNEIKDAKRLNVNLLAYALTH